MNQRVISQERLNNLKNETYDKLLELREYEVPCDDEEFDFNPSDAEKIKLTRFIKLMLLRKPANCFNTWKHRVFDKPSTDPRLIYLLKDDMERKKHKYVLSKK